MQNYKAHIESYDTHTSTMNKQNKNKEGSKGQYISFGSV